MNINYNNILIRNAIESDAVQLETWWNDGSVMAHAGFPDGVHTNAERIRKQIENYTDKKRTLIIEYKDIPIGEMNYEMSDDSEFEIGIKICESDYQERGIGRVVLSLFIEELFNMGAKLIFLTTNLKNKRAQHVYEKLGFKKTKIEYDSWEDQRGELQSTVFYDLEKENFVSYK